MSEEQATSLRRQIDDKVIDARNEIIMQATNAFLFGRQVALASLGLTVLGVEQIQALLTRSVERGEVLESDAEQMLDALRRRAAEGTTANISSRLSTLLNRVPGVSMVYQAPMQPATPTDTPAASQPDQPPEDSQSAATGK